MEDNTMKDKTMDESVASVTETPTEPETDIVASLPIAVTKSKEDATNCGASEQTATPVPVTAAEAVKTIPAPASQPEPQLEPKAEPPAPSETESAPISAAMAPELAVIAEKIRELGEAFEAKLRWDDSKQVAIDRQYEELKVFRDNAMEKAADHIARDVIAEIDSAGTLAAHYAAQQYSEGDFARLHGDFKKLLRIVEGFQNALRDLLDKHGFESWRTEVGERFNPKRQRALKTTATEQQELDGALKESIRHGFEKAGRIVRPEMIDLYKFMAPPPQAPQPPSPSR